MKNRKRASLLLAAAALIAASCSKIEPLTAPTLSSGDADFGVVAALGTSVTAGFQSGGLVDRHQLHSYAVLFAQQVNARAMDLPLINGAGLPQLLELTHLYPPPIQIARINAPPGDPTNAGLPTPYHNLGIPGARVQDVIDSRHYLNQPYFPIIERGKGTLARQIATQLDPPPTFLLFELGSSEILGPALNGTIVGLTSVAAFADTFGRTLDTLAALMPNVKMAVVNVPDITSLPFFTTLSNKQLDANGQPVVDANGRPRFLLGPNNAAMIAGDLVLLKALPLLAAGHGYPNGTFSYLSGSEVPGQGIGLPDSLVLSNSEATTLSDRAHRFNTIIDTTASSKTKPRDFATVDLDGLLRRGKSPGIEIRGVVYTTTFVTGGLISLDGIHPNDIAQALLCNEVIRAVNGRFSSTIQPVDPLRYATLTASGAQAAR